MRVFGSFCESYHTCSWAAKLLCGSCSVYGWRPPKYAPRVGQTTQNNHIRYLFAICTILVPECERSRSSPTLRAGEPSHGSFSRTACQHQKFESWIVSRIRRSGRLNLSVGTVVLIRRF